MYFLLMMTFLKMVLLMTYLLIALHKFIFWYLIKTVQQQFLIVLFFQTMNKQGQNHHLHHIKSHYVLNHPSNEHWLKQVKSHILKSQNCQQRLRQASTPQNPLPKMPSVSELSAWLWSGSLRTDRRHCLQVSVHSLRFNFVSRLKLLDVL